MILASGCSLGRVVFLSQTTLPCFSCAWYQQSWVLNSLKTAERCFSGLRSAQRVSRCLPHTWVRSQIKGGKERSLCSQTPWCSGALAPHLDAHSVILKNWEVSVSGRRIQSSDFFCQRSQGDPVISGVSSQIMLWRQLPCCLSWILTSLAAITDLQPGLRNIHVEEGCSQVNLFSCHCTRSQLFTCLILQHLEGKCAQEKYTPGSLHLWDGFCKLQLMVFQPLLLFGAGRSKSGNKTIWPQDFETWGHN